MDGIFSGGVSEFIREGLENPGEGVATGSAQSVGGNAERHEGGAKEKVLEKGAGKLVAGNARGGSELFAFAETDEVIAPSDEFAGRVETALEEMKSGGAIVVVMKIVFASPEEFYRDADLFRDGASFEHVVVGEAAAESAAGALQVNDDVVVGNIENFGDEQAAIFRGLTGRPEFQFAVVIVGETIFGLHGGVREEGIGVSGLNCFRGGLERFLGVAITAKGKGGRLLGKLLGAASKACAALLGGGTFLPLGVQFLPGAVGLPPSVRDDGDTAMQTEKIGTSIHGKSMAYTGQRFDFVKIGAEELTGVNRTLFVDGVEHSRNLEVDAEKIFSSDDRRVVNAVNGLANDFVVFGILEFDGLEIGRRESGYFFGECTVSECAVR